MDVNIVVDSLANIVREHPLAVLTLFGAILLSFPCCFCAIFLLFQLQNPNRQRPDAQRPKTPRTALKPDERTAPKQDVRPYVPGLMGEGGFPGMGGMGGLGGMGGMGGMGLDNMDPALRGLLGNNASFLQNQFPNKTQPKERAVGIMISVTDPNCGPTYTLETASRDSFIVAEIFQKLEWQTFQLQDDRVEPEAKPTATNLLELLGQLRENDPENITALTLYIGSHARISTNDSQPEFLLQQPTPGTKKPKWIPFHIICSYLFQFNVPTYFIFDVVLPQGEGPRGFLRTVKTHVKERPHTHVLLACVRPRPSLEDKNVGLFAGSLLKLIDDKYFKTHDLTFPEIHRMMLPLLSTPTSSDVILHYNNELGHVTLNMTLGRACRPRGIPFLAPHPHYAVWLPQADEIKKALTTSNRGVTIANGAKYISKVYQVHGPTLSGKTTLIGQLAWDHDILHHFMDGIFVITFTRDEPIVNYLQQLARISLGYDGYFHTIDEAKDFMQQHLSSALVILDGVKDTKVIEAFRFSFPHVCAGTVLFTTKEPFDDSSIEIAGSWSLNTKGTLLQALSLLSSAATTSDNSTRGAVIPDESVTLSLPAVATDIANILDNQWAALGLASSLVAFKSVKENKSLDWRKALQTLQAVEDNAPLSRAFQATLDSLTPARKALLQALAVFPSNTAISLDAVLHLWKPTPPLKAASTIKKLCRLDLIMLVRTPIGYSIAIHPVISDLLRESNPDMRMLHRNFANSYLELCEKEKEWHLVPDDGYYFQYIPYSWRAAGMPEFKTQLRNYEWIRAKLYGSDLVSFVGDLKNASSDSSLNIIRETVELAKDHLYQSKWELPSQLYGRLYTSEDTVAKDICEKIISKSSPLPIDEFTCSEELWLRPLYHSGLKIPASSPLSSLQEDMHKKAVTCALFLPNNRVATGSEDDTVKIWCLETGKLIATLPHPGVNTFVVTVDGKLASGSREKRTITIWNDIEKAEGESVQVLAKPPPSAPKPENIVLDQVMVCLGRTGCIRDEENEAIRDAVLVYNKRDEEGDFTDTDKIIFMGHDDQRPIMASWSHDREVKIAVLSEVNGHHIVCVGDCEGNVIFLRLEKYSNPIVGQELDSDAD